MNRNIDWRSLYDISRKIGSGKNSDAFICIENSTNDKFAAKIVSNENYNFKVLSSQFVVMKKFNNENIIHYSEIFQGFSDKDKEIVFIEEYCPNGSFEDQIQSKIEQRKKFTENEIIKYSYSVLKGIQYLHSQGISYPHLKATNILFDSKNTIKLSDYAKGLLKDETWKNSQKISEIDNQLKKIDKSVVNCDLKLFGYFLLFLCQVPEITKFEESNSTEIIQDMLFSKIKSFYSLEFLKLIERLISSDNDLTIPDIFRDISYNKIITTIDSPRTISELCNTNKIQEHERKGDNFYNEGKYLDAIDIYRKAEETALNYQLKYSEISIMVKMAGCFIALNDFSNSITILKEALKGSQELTSVTGTRLRTRIHSLLAESYILIGSFNSAFSEIEIAKEHLEDEKLQKTSEYAHCLLTKGMILTKSGDINNSLKLLSKSCDIYRKMEGNSRNVARCMSWIGEIYRIKSDYEVSIQNISIAIKIYERILGMSHPDLAACFNNLGLALMSKGELDNSINYFTKALEINRSKLGENHPETAAAMNNLGNAFSAMGNYKEAIEMLNNAFKIWTERFGELHPDTASAICNIGCIYFRLKKFKESLLYHKKSYEIRRKLFQKHIDTAISLNNLGNVYYSMRDFNKALRYYEDSLKLKREILGESHVSLASTLNNIGLIYQTKSDYEKAINNFKTALKIKETNSTEPRIDTAITYDHIGKVYESCKQFDKAIKNYKLALEKSSIILGEDHEITLKFKTHYRKLFTLIIRK